MSGKWESMAVAALLSSTMNAQSAPMENNNQDTENPNRIEVVQEDTRDTLRNDSAMAWEEVQNMANVPPSNGNSSRESAVESMRADSLTFNEVNSRLNGNVPLNECVERSVTECLVQQEGTHSRISQRYGASNDAYEGNVYGDFLEYLATSGDKKLGRALGLSEDKMTPENITMALAYGPEISREMQEQIFNEARQDGRYEGYRNQTSSMGVMQERYPELSSTGQMPEGGARLSIGLEQSKEMCDKINQKYGENANALIVRAFTADKELAESFGFKKDEKVDAQQLIYMLAEAETLPKDVQDKLVTPKDRENADKVLDFMVNKDKDTKYFSFNSETQKGENKVQEVADNIRGNDNKTFNLNKELSNIHSKTVNTQDDMSMAVMRHIQAQR
ncbi:MAG: hypothetical protein E7005_03040 [Alphaproteobacteria bacterium]|nr:hypothetical protein [Alphaproteobacteria bacterium]